MYMAGPYTLRLIFQGFVVLVGVLILSGAVNTAIVGANGVLNRISEDGVLTPWFRKPHGKYGTSFRLINMIGILQCVTIVLSRGNVYLLAALYAFGVIWSFSFKALAMLVLRFTEPGHRDFRVPGNIKIGSTGIPRRADPHHPAAVCHRARQPHDQAPGNHGRRQLLGLPLCRLRDFRKDHPPPARRKITRCARSSASPNSPWWTAKR